MGWFSGKDWNVVAIIFERTDLFQVNGQRAKGGDAVKARDGAKGHPRTIYCAVFDQKGAFLEGAPGAGAKSVGPDVLAKLQRELPMTRTVQEVLKTLESGSSEKVAKSLVWNGYAKKS